MWFIIKIRNKKPLKQEFEIPFIEELQAERERERERAKEKELQVE